MKRWERPPETEKVLSSTLAREVEMWTCQEPSTGQFEYNDWVQPEGTTGCYCHCEDRTSNTSGPWV